MIRQSVTAPDEGIAPSQGMDSLPRLSVPSPLLAWEYWFNPEKFTARCAAMGDRFQLSLPGLPPLICISSPQDNRRIFAGDQTALHFGEGLTKMSPHEVVLGSTSISVKDGDEHLADRRMLAPHFSSKAIKVYAPLFERQTRQAMATWPVAESFSFHQAMMKLTLDIIIEAVFGIRNPDRHARLKAATLELVEVLGGPRFMLSTIVAVSRGGKWDGKYTRLNRCKDKVDAIVAEELAERRGGEKTGEEDILTVYMRLQEQNPEQMTDAAIYDAMRTLLIGGYETTASSMAWLAERLVRSPDVVTQLERAVDAGDDAYIEAVVSESLRTRPNLPHTVRYVVKPFDMGDGLVLPPGTMVLPMMYLCHKRPDIYPQPERFNPQRFLDRQATMYELINFGGGIRRCLGAPFALLEMREILRTIVSEYHFEATSAKGEKIGRRSITLVPGSGAQVVLQRRKRERQAA